METQDHTLYVLLGPTGVGKTDLSLDIAERLGSPIISADSRQIFRELPIGTAAPTPEQRARVPHLFVGTHSVRDYYSAGMYEVEVLEALKELFRKYRGVLLTGGSMMYIDAVCRGIDDIPDPFPEVREELYARYGAEGLDGILAQLRLLDPDYYAKVDRRNYKRVIHGLEICLSTGRPFSSFHRHEAKERPFRIVKIGLYRERAELCRRIDARVLEMMEQGLEEEARAVYPLRHLNALNTVGYKEMFEYFDGSIDRAEAVRRIQRNSRVYARKQMTWFRRDSTIRWFHPEADKGTVLTLVT
ncbi:tRNA (adenosine(37)-N6)-dimethylallyltransferase MiaA [Porphyromonas gingivalis]|uniref:tRNA (adenosine(37)-N6)-dimethylallyltransferase MiaA n=1 Tax=Porphyromonas gingivalis TaxID=837 RepID=UPI000BE73582|nr:tRNA (adenosine(37)-N6)-dimethylallyltransferase MiaA [Porphyromonas gingivalis]PDP59633.1 tRNA (adenosine(37)-N6)-dimethylallyltransferase MiaA [Porphyromonas gingivalis]RZQ69999.1 tRNA (adenosine(37)-N6)-dimethylallyltransferase MiaA [Porphyromonas gingivalis]